MKRFLLTHPLAGRFLAVALLLLAAGARLHQAAELGVQADEGVHVTAASRVAAGDVLYRDLFENRTPGVIWILALLFRAGGDHVLTGRVLATGAALMTIAALFAAGRLAARSLRQEPASSVSTEAAPLATAGATALATALFFALAPLPLFWSRYTMLEHFSAAAAPAAVAAALRAHRDDAPRWWLAAGVATGLAVLAKQSSLVLVAAMILTFALWAVLRAALGPRGNDAAAVLRNGALWAAGAIAITVLMLAALALQGALRPFFHYLSGAGRATTPSWSELWSAWWPWLSARPFVPLALFGALLLLSLWKRRPAGALLLFWAAGEAGVLLLAPQLEFTQGGFSHYTPPAVAAFALLAGVAVVALGHRLRRPGPARWLAVVALLLTILTLPGWLRDLRAAFAEAEYPQPTFAAERHVGRSAALLAEPGQPILVMGNAIFYYRASRPPASPFFHLPAYLADSPLAQESTAALNEALSNPATGAVVLSRLHLDERLPPSVETTLWQRWEPVARFPYAYQRDVFLFRPRGAQTAADPIAVYGDQIALLNVDVRPLSPGTLLVGLTWRSDEPPADSYTAFVHLLGPDGQLLAQHDGVPVVGFRPTETWQSAEQIVDWHWIEIGERERPPSLQLSVGLYYSQSGERLPVQTEDDATETDSFTIPLTIIE